MTDRVTAPVVAPPQPVRPGALFGLAVAQFLASFGQITMATLSGIVGARLTEAPQLATLPVTAGIVGVAAAAWPLAVARRRFGNRAVFVAALLWAAGGAALAAASISARSFTGFCMGCFMMGNNMAMVAQYRFAATQFVPMRLVSQAVSAVMVGTLACAFVAPWVALKFRDRLDGEFSGSYAILITAYVAAAVLIAILPVGTRTRDATPTAGTPLAVLLRRRAVQLAIIAAAGGYGVMSLIMTATPISMHVIDHHSADATANTIRLHILGMFTPSLFSGWLIARFGVHRMLWTGLLLQLACIAIATSGHFEWQYRTALILLGIGWNLLYIGGTALLATAGGDHAGPRLQGLNDLIMFGTMATASLSAGGLLYTVGWSGTNMAALAVLALIVLALIRR